MTKTIIPEDDNGDIFCLNVIPYLIGNIYNDKNTFYYICLKGNQHTVLELSLLNKSYYKYINEKIICKFPQCATYVKNLENKTPFLVSNFVKYQKDSLNGKQITLIFARVNKWKTLLHKPLLDHMLENPIIIGIMKAIGAVGAKLLGLDKQDKENYETLIYVVNGIYKEKLRSYCWYLSDIPSESDFGKIIHTKVWEKSRQFLTITTEIINNLEENFNKEEKISIFKPLCDLINNKTKKEYLEFKENYFNFFSAQLPQQNDNNKNDNNKNENTLKLK